MLSDLDFARVCRTTTESLRCGTHTHAADGSTTTLFLSQNRDETFPGSCVWTCKLPCPVPIYDMAGWDSLWVAHVLPGLLSIPFNLINIWTFFQSWKKQRGKCHTIYGCGDDAAEPLGNALTRKTVVCAWQMQSRCLIIGAILYHMQSTQYLLGICNDCSLPHCVVCGALLLCPTPGTNASDKIIKLGLMKLLPCYCAILALIYVFVETVPSTFASHDNMCDGKTSFAYDELWQSMPSSDGCAAASMSSAFLLSMLLGVVVLLVQVKSAMNASLHMRKGKSQRLCSMILTLVAITVIPLVSGNFR